MTGNHDDDFDRDQHADRSADSTQPDGDDGQQADIGNGTNQPGELDADTVDKRFAELVADFEDELEWPNEKDSSAPATDEATSSTPVTATSDDENEPTLFELWDTELPEDPADPEEHYTPPPAPPVPRPSAPAILGVLFIIGGLILVISPNLLNLNADLGTLTGIAAFVGGAVMLVWRLRPEPDEDDDGGDNGAIV